MTTCQTVGKYPWNLYWQATTKWYFKISILILYAYLSKKSVRILDIVSIYETECLFSVFSEEQVFSCLSSGIPLQNQQCFGVWILFTGNDGKNNFKLSVLKNSVCF